VTYRDGSHFDEYDADGTEHGWGEVCSYGVAILTLRQGQDLTSVQIPDGTEAVFTRRHHLTPSLSEHVIIHIVGYRGRHRENYLFLFDDGRTESSSDFNAY
jgi:hypothetical protein